MPRMWVKRGGRRFCVSSNVSTQFQRKLDDPDPADQEIDHDRLGEATNTINELLERVEREIHDSNPHLEISFIAIRSADGEDRLQLGYIDTSEEVFTYFD